MTNQEIKTNKWETTKKELLSIIPTQYAIDVEGLDDDSEYFHPIIKIDDNFIIKGQNDIKGNKNHKIYGWELETLEKKELDGLQHTIIFYFYDLEHIQKVINNWDKHKIKINEYADMAKIINENINTLLLQD